uniref:Uncharacterized protein n=1 Tax=Oryza sativa subsp. japonica TaxID=39947 RepID=Q69JP5_ORYSJ|nr:hypothetical protein [Oryza sativa Japonica Group]
MWRLKSIYRSAKWRLKSATRHGTAQAQADLNVKLCRACPWATPTAQARPNKTQAVFGRRAVLCQSAMPRAGLSGHGPGHGNMVTFLAEVTDVYNILKLACIT